MNTVIRTNERKIVNSNINQNEDCTKVTITYDDDTILYITLKDNAPAHVKCNKTFQINPDGTIDII